MKKCIVILLLLFCFTSVAYAHPGGTDKYGGHNETATGEYHYHHGYPAHSHAGGCPYDYHDAVDHKETSSTSKKTELKLPVWTPFAAMFIVGVGIIYVNSEKPNKKCSDAHNAAKKKALNSRNQCAALIDDIIICDGFAKNENIYQNILETYVSRFIPNGISDATYCRAELRREFCVLLNRYPFPDYAKESAAGADKHCLSLLIKCAENLLLSGRFHCGDGVLDSAGEKICRFWMQCVFSSVEKSYMTTEAAKLRIEQVTKNYKTMLFKRLR